MAKNYEFRIPLRTANIELPEFTIGRFHIQETINSKRQSRPKNPEFEIMARFTSPSQTSTNKKKEVYQQAELLTHFITFSTNKKVIAGDPQKLYNADTGGVVQESGSWVFPKESMVHFDSLFDNLVENNSIEDRVYRSLRWYATGVGRENTTDAFISFWLSIEILAKPKEKEHIAQLDNDDAIEDAMATVRKEVDSNYLKSRINNFLADRVRDESIPEAITRMIRETLGDTHRLVRDDLEDEFKKYQRNRSNLVHDGIEIPDLKNKTNRLRNISQHLLRHKMDDVFRNVYSSPVFWEFSQVGSEPTLHFILSQVLGGLTLDEIEKLAVALTRNVEEAADLRGKITGLLDNDKLGIEESMRGNESVYKLKPCSQLFVCPVCGVEFWDTFILACHLAHWDYDQKMKNPYHEGPHGDWRSKYGFSSDVPSTLLIERWIIDHSDEVRV